MNKIERSIILAAVCSGLLAACGGGDDADSTSQPSSGTLNIGVTDAPVDSAAAVVVKFTAIEVQPENGNAITFDINPARSIDVLALAGGKKAAILENQSLAAGRYEWIRLHIVAEQNAQDGSYIDLTTGERYPLFIPSGSETGLKLVRGFTVSVGGNTDFTIDFDLRKSVIAPPGQAPNYFLKPALRIVDNLQVGSIAGSVAQSLIPTGCAPFVYIFSGSDVTPDDMDATAASDANPSISVPAQFDAASAEYRYTASFLEAGAYTVSFTCDGDIDTPEADQTLVFTGTTNVTVTANQTSTVNFQ